MTTIRDIITDTIEDAKKIKEQALDKQSQQLDDDMQELDEIEEEMTNDLLEETLATVQRRLIG